MSYQGPIWAFVDLAPCSTVQLSSALTPSPSSRTSSMFWWHSDLNQELPASQPRSKQMELPPPVVVVTDVLASLSEGMQEIVSMHMLVSLHPYREAGTNKLLLPQLYERYRSHPVFVSHCYSLDQLCLQSKKKPLGDIKRCSLDVTCHKTQLFQI